MNDGPAMVNMLRAGTGVVDITPDRMLLLEGYQPRLAEGTLDPLIAGAIVFDDGATRAALVATDLCGILPSSVQRIRSLAEAASGISSANIIVLYSHTHSGPAVTHYLGQTPDAVYLGWMEEQIAAAIAAASERLRPVTLGVGQGSCDFNVNRRLRTETGTLMRANPRGLVDRRVRVLRFDPADTPSAPGSVGSRPLPRSDPVAILFSYVCHPTVLRGDNCFYSGDYPGAARRFVERAYRGDASGGPAALFIPGCSGNVRPHLVDDQGNWRSGNRYELVVLGRLLGSAVVNAAERVVGEPVSTIAIGRRSVRLPYARVASAAELRAALDGPRNYWARALLDRIERGDPLPDAEETEVQVLRLGRHWLVALPGETTLEIGLAIERGLADLGRARPEEGDSVVTIGYANDYVAYLCAASLMTEGGYEPTSWYEYLRWGPFAPELESVLVEAALSLARELSTASG